VCVEQVLSSRHRDLTQNTDNGNGEFLHSPVGKNETGIRVVAALDNENSHSRVADDSSARDGNTKRDQNRSGSVAHRLSSHKLTFVIDIVIVVVNKSISKSGKAPAVASGDIEGQGVRASLPNCGVEGGAINNASPPGAVRGVIDLCGKEAKQVDLPQITALSDGGTSFTVRTRFYTGSIDDSNGILLDTPIRVFFCRGRWEVPRSEPQKRASE